MKTNPRLRFYLRHRGGALWSALVLLAALEAGFVVDSVHSWQTGLRDCGVTPVQPAGMMPVDPGTLITDPGHYL